MVKSSHTTYILLVLVSLLFITGCSNDNKDLYIMDCQKSCQQFGTLYNSYDTLEKDNGNVTLKCLCNTYIEVSNND